MSAVASGVTGASPIWNDIMTQVLADQKDIWPRKPENVLGYSVCTLTGRIPSADNVNEGGEACPTRFEYITKGRENVGSGVLSREMVPVQRETGWYLYKADDPLAEMQEKLLISDGMSKYCLECNHDGEPRSIVNIVSYLQAREAKKERDVRIQKQ